MKNLLARARAAAASLWAREPVLVATALPVLVSVGVISQDQASAVTNVLATAGVVVVQVGAALGIRSKVSSPATAAAMHANELRAAAALVSARRRLVTALASSAAPSTAPVQAAPAPAPAPPVTPPTPPG